MSDPDRETDALSRIWDVLQGFGLDARLRMVEYLQDRVGELHRLDDAATRGKGVPRQDWP